MKDILPREMEIRDYVIQLIKDTYKSYGFVSMETPCIEHIENLCSKQGGDNEKLIFKILKRGEKLKIAEAQTEEDVVDGGLRYDLTVPLARYYSNYINELPSPFKALQIGSVWRADRPQRGRFRQFMQCDIDVLGDASYLSEVELILATTTLLGKLGFTGFTVNYNDRKLLKAIADYSGFQEDDHDQVFIILDKLDKIGADRVAEELKEIGYEQNHIERFMDLFQTITKDLAGIHYCKEVLGSILPEETSTSLEMILSIVNASKECEFQLVFNPTLVRGQSYYTGTIFEIDMEGMSGSVAGGGRYDKMIGHFTGQDTPAVGFSIGFERIVMLLLEREYQVNTNQDKAAFLLEKNITKERMIEAFADAKKLRDEGAMVQIATMKKNKKFQKEQLQEQGYMNIMEYYRE